MDPGWGRKCTDLLNIHPWFFSIELFNGVLVDHVIIIIISLKK